jgi:hypothetical protein
MLNIICHVVLVNKYKVSEKDFPDLRAEIISVYWTQQKIFHIVYGGSLQTQLWKPCA